MSTYWLSSTVSPLWFCVISTIPFSMSSFDTPLADNTYHTALFFNPKSNIPPLLLYVAPSKYESLVSNRILVTPFEFIVPCIFLVYPSS